VISPVDDRGEAFAALSDLARRPDYEEPAVRSELLLRACVDDVPVALEFNLDCRRYCLTYVPKELGMMLVLPDFEKMDWKHEEGVRVWITDAHLEAFAQGVAQLVAKAKAMRLLDDALEHA